MHNTSDFQNMHISTTTDLPLNRLASQSENSYYIIDPTIFEVLIVFVIAMASVIILGCLAFIHWRIEHYLASWKLNKIFPVHIFKKGEDPSGCCAICLDDYLECDKLRILPCSHSYHYKCIDPLLHEDQPVCPLCRSKVKLTREDQRMDNTLTASGSTTDTTANFPAHSGYHTGENNIESRPSESAVQIVVDVLNSELAHDLQLTDNDTTCSILSHTISSQESCLVNYCSTKL